jgi:hypothetical protein
VSAVRAVVTIARRCPEQVFGNYLRPGFRYAPAAYAASFLNSGSLMIVFAGRWNTRTSFPESICGISSSFWKQHQAEASQRRVYLGRRGVEDQGTVDANVRLSPPPFENPRRTSHLTWACAGCCTGGSSGPALFRRRVPLEVVG